MLFSTERVASNRDSSLSSSTIHFLQFTLASSIDLATSSLASILEPLQNQFGAGGVRSHPHQSNYKMSDDQSRVVMKFEEKRVLLQAILDRRDSLFGPLAAKMKPAKKQALWENAIAAFRASKQQ